MKLSAPPVGSVFGRLTVLGPAPVNAHQRSQAEVQCACGTVRAVPVARLLAGSAVSCGCARGRRGTPAEIAASFAPGAVHGLLTIVRTEGTGRDRIVHCVCACGRQAEVLYPYALRNGLIRSCGCLARGSARRPM